MKEKNKNAPTLKLPRRVIGFYMSYNTGIGGKHSIVAVTEKPSVFEGIASSNLICMRPVTGRQEIRRGYILDKFTEVTNEKAEELWEAEYASNPKLRMKSYQVLLFIISF